MHHRNAYFILARDQHSNHTKQNEASSAPHFHVPKKCLMFTVRRASSNIFSLYCTSIAKEKT
uniref:Uncharacterized protein n=1 Tax=Arundo donax TaxID=35708 RepID=A0A0A8ZN09_ARUDO